MKKALSQVVRESREFFGKFYKEAVREMRFKMRGRKSFKYFDHNEIENLKNISSNRSMDEFMRNSKINDVMRQWVLTQRNGKYISQNFSNLMILISPVYQHNKFQIDSLEVFYQEINKQDLKLFIRISEQHADEFLSYEYFINDFILKIRDKLIEFFNDNKQFNFEHILMKCLSARYDPEYFQRILLFYCNQLIESSNKDEKAQFDPAEIFTLIDEIESSEDPFTLLNSVLAGANGPLETTKQTISAFVQFLEQLSDINQYENRSFNRWGSKSNSDTKRKYFYEYSTLQLNRIEVN
jgi:hypothetical protein